MLKYASALLMAWGLSEMIVGVGTRTGYPTTGILAFIFAGYFFFKSRFASRLGMDLIIFLFVVIMLGLLSAFSV